MWKRSLSESPQQNHIGSQTRSLWKQPQTGIVGTLEDYALSEEMDPTMQGALHSPLGKADVFYANGILTLLVATPPFTNIQPIQDSHIEAGPSTTSSTLPHLNLHSPNTFFSHTQPSASFSQPGPISSVKSIGYQLSIPPCQPRTLISDPPVLAALGLAWDTLEKRLLCKTCNAFILLPNGVSHSAPKKEKDLPSQHTQRLDIDSLLKTLKLDKNNLGQKGRDRVQDALVQAVHCFRDENWSVLPSTKPSPHPKVTEAKLYPAVEGIAVSDGWMCKYCGICRLNGMGDHTSSEHQDRSAAKEIPCRMQTFYLSQSYRKWFAVEENKNILPADEHGEPSLRF